MSQFEQIKPAGYIRGSATREIIWGEDCVCEDPVFPSSEFDTDAAGTPCVSIPFYIAPPDAEILRKENEKLNMLLLAVNDNLAKSLADNERLRKDLSDATVKALYWADCLRKCGRILDLDRYTPIPAGVVDAVEKLVNSTLKGGAA